MRTKWGCQTPNGEYNPADCVEVFQDGFYIVMQDQLNRVAIDPSGGLGLRDRAPEALIMLRFYLQNWYMTNPEAWVSQMWTILNQKNASDPKSRRNIELIDCYTWANEQNLKAESGGAIGSSPGDMIKPGQWEIIRDWNNRVLDAIDAIPEFRDKLRVFPAMAMGNSDDQDDGAGVGLDIMQPVIVRCHYGAIHPYWNSRVSLNDEWVGLGRVSKQLPFFKGRKVLVTETGNFDVTNPLSPSQYVQAGYFFQGIPEIDAFAYFIFADPTKQHQQNDMSRNVNIYDEIKKATKTERTRYVPPSVPILPQQPPSPPEEPDPMPEPNPPPQTSPGKLLIAYQVWQWGEWGTGLPQNYAALLTAMRDCGAFILADKYADSDALQGQFDFSPMGIKSIQVMKDRRQWCEDNGFMYVPWDVPRAIPINGNAFEGARQEALFHADVCNQVGLKYRVSDLEFYPGFFGYSRSGVSFFNSMRERNDAALEYYETFAANSGTRTILQPDLRQRGTVDFKQLVPYLDAIVGQSYAYFFMKGGDSRPHSAIVQDFIDASKALNPPTFGLCLYCENGSSNDTPVYLAQELLDQAVAAGATYLFIYKAPVTPSLGKLTQEYAGNGDEMTIDELKAKAWANAEAAGTLAAEFQALAEEARTLGYGWMGNGLDAAKLGLNSVELAAKTALKAPKE